MLLFWPLRLGVQKRRTPGYQAGRKACVGLETSPTNPRFPHPPTPHSYRNPIRPLLWGECVAPRRETREASQSSSEITRRGGQSWRRAPGKGYCRGWGLAGGGLTRSAGSLLQLSPRGRRASELTEIRYKLLKIISVLLNMRERIQRLDLYRRVTRGDFFNLFFFSYWLNKHSLFSLFLLFSLSFFFPFLRWDWNTDGAKHKYKYRDHKYS